MSVADGFAPAAVLFLWLCFAWKNIADNIRAAWKIYLLSGQRENMLVQH